MQISCASGYGHRQMTTTATEIFLLSLILRCVLDLLFDASRASRVEASHPVIIDALSSKQHFFKS